MIRYFIKNLRDLFKFNLLRTILTGLGIFIGIASVVVILTISKSFSGDLTQKYTSKVLIGLATSNSSDINEEELMSNSAIQLKLEEIRDRAEIEQFQPISNELTVDVFSIEQNELKPAVKIEFQDVTVIEGKNFGNTTGNTVILRDNKEFGLTYKLHEAIYIQNERFEIIGITNDLGETSPAFFFPKRLKKQIVFDENPSNSSFQLVISENTDANKVQKQIITELNELMPEGAKFVNYAEETSMALKESIGTITLFLSFISGISLVVAAINVVNIMYISSLEKMKEVAIYRSLGMTKKQIITLFLVESLCIVMIFSVLGYIMGLLIASTILLIMGVSIQISVFHILLVIIVSFVLGIGASIRPAMKAANSDPASLLR